MSVLVLAEHDNASLKSATFHAVTAARELGDVDVLVIGYQADGVVTAVAAIPGVAKVFRAEAPYLMHPTAENAAATALTAIARGKYSHVLAPATSFGKNIAPRIAAKLDVAQVSDITGIEAPDTFVRPIYAGNAFATVRSADPIKVVTVRTTAFDAAASTGGNATI
jgi:electron transfer flavoprotein alpha subunit